MPDGTTFKDIFIARLHRLNVETVMETAEENLKYARESLLIAAALPPEDLKDSEESDLVWDIREVINGHIDSIIDASRTLYFAEQMKMFPEDCVDDYDPELENGGGI